ncbi:hypothetical protein CHUAL_005670 [Chamberlinius hualienensis]
MGNTPSYFRRTPTVRNSVRASNRSTNKSAFNRSYKKPVSLRKSKPPSLKKPKSVKCSCCRKKFGIMNSLRKLKPLPRYCTECHKEVCKKCYDNKICHKCSSGVRKDKITDLQGMDRPQLMKILKQLHYDAQTDDIQETSDLILAILNQCDMDAEFVKEFEAAQSKRSTPMVTQVEIIHEKLEESHDILPEQNHIQIDVKNVDDEQKIDNPYDNGQPRFVETLSYSSLVTNDSRLRRLSNTTEQPPSPRLSIDNVKIAENEASVVNNHMLKSTEALENVADQSDTHTKLLIAPEVTPIVNEESVPASNNHETDQSAIIAAVDSIIQEADVQTADLPMDKVEETSHVTATDDKDQTPSSSGETKPVIVTERRRSLLEKQVSCITPCENIHEAEDVINPLRSSNVRRASQSQENIHNFNSKPLKTSTPLLTRATSFSLRSLTSSKAIQDFDIQKLRQILDRALENVTEQELAIIVTHLWRIRRKLKPREQKVRVSMIGSLSDIAVPDVISSLTIRQIKIILEKHLVSYSECSEKYEMVQKLIRLWEDNEKKSEDKDEIPTGERCVICLSEKPNCVFQDCGHLVTCADCATNIKECPICRLYIVKVLRIFRA